MTESVTLYRPVGAEELRLIEASGMRAFPPRLPEQPIFYPVTNEAYAVQIANGNSGANAYNYQPPPPMNQQPIDAEVPDDLPF